MYSTVPPSHLQDFSPPKTGCAADPDKPVEGSIRVAGIDGCRGGWFAVLLEDSPSRGGRPRVTDVLLFDTEDFKTLAGILDGCSLALIDIPIGLPARGERPSDSAVRKLLGARGSSIFPMPVRDAVYADSYAEACRINAEATGKKLSKQAWNILGKVRSIDRFLRMREEYRLILRESSPEYCFVLAAGCAPGHGKRTPEGVRERSAILAARATGWEGVRVEARNAYSRRELSDDDILDAGILAVSAYLAVSGGMVEVPSEIEYDDCGLPVQAVFGTQMPGKKKRRQG